jgi:hypothetical protein
MFINDLHQALQEAKVVLFADDRCIGLTTLPPSVSQLSRQCGILNILQPYRPPRPVTEMALLYFLLY